MVLWFYVDMMLCCNGIFLGQTCNTSIFPSFSKQLENNRGSDLKYSHALKTHIESITEEVIQLYQYHKE